MEETIFNLVKNTIPIGCSNEFVRERANIMTNKEILSLAEQELETIEYFVRIELPDWNYWKNKKQKLKTLIKNIKK